MKIIKCRAYDSYLKQWYYAKLKPNLSWEITEKSVREDKFTDNDSVKDWQLYTGVHDKNGKEIFEGDIVKAIAPFDHKDSNRISEIIEDVTDTAWAVRSISDDGEPCNFGLNIKWWAELEVIGNIHENPELLKW